MNTARILCSRALCTRPPPTIQRCSLQTTRAYTESFCDKSIYSKDSVCGFSSTLQGGGKGGRRLSSAFVFDKMYNDPVVSKRIEVLERGPGEQDLASGHLLAWAKSKKMDRPDTGAYLFDGAAARAFREKHEVFMQLVLESEIDAKLGR